MTWLGVTAITIVALWLTTVTVAVMLCIRQLAIHRVRLEQLVRGGAGAGTGPTIGFSVAPALVETYPELQRPRALVVVLSGNCVNCLRLIEEWEEAQEGPSQIDAEDILLLVTGQEGTPADDAARRLAPFGSVLREPHSSRLAQALNMTYRPSALVLEEGLITGTAILEHTSEIDDLLVSQAGGASREGSIAGAAE